MKNLMILFVMILLGSAFAEPMIINGQKYVCEDGVCVLQEDVASVTNAHQHNMSTSVAGNNTPRIAQGYMNADDFISFIENEPQSHLNLADQAWWIMALLALAGGLCMNLTPCVLPMIPINLMIIGRSVTRGTMYGLGIAVAYGVLGILAAMGGMAFGEIQGSPWFNIAISAIFIIMALALMDVFFIDFSKGRTRAASLRNNMLPNIFAFVMGAVSALLAGACVAPVLIVVLFITADLFAKGTHVALFLPFVLGMGMALPWPFAGAGLQVLPKPGAWMAKVNKVFGVVVLGFAAWYGYLAWQGFSDFGKLNSTSHLENGDRQTVIFDSPKDFTLEGLKRPVLVDCWATWCKNCSAMDKKTLSDSRVKEVLREKGMTLVKLQAEDISELRRIPGFGAVMGLPAFLIFE
ncbi:MAG: thioredoxin family protein [Kiritimatiellae bacterium]|nr:thioredoxin family protein [Kiritimatiellia bacterium]